MQHGWTAIEGEAGDGAFAEANRRRHGIGCRNKHRADEVGEVGVVADDEDVFVATAFVEEFLKVLEGGFGG